MKRFRRNAITAVVLAIAGGYAMLLHNPKLSSEQRSLDETHDYRDKALQGDVKAQYEFAHLLFEGKVVPQNYEESVRWYRTAADQGYAPAQSSLGFMYEQGLGVSKDYAEALRWYRMAAGNGDSDAEYNLGTMYRLGMGVSNDFGEAVKWYRMSAGQGNANGQYGLGFMYYNGEGVQRDFGVAAHLYHQAADQGLARAQYDLSYMYRDGRGVPQDHLEAERLLRQAASQGEARAQRSLEEGSSVFGGRRQIISLAIFLGCFLFLIAAVATRKRSRGVVLAGIVGLLYAGSDLFLVFGHKADFFENIANQVSFGRYMLLGIFSTMLILIVIRGRKKSRS